MKKVLFGATLGVVALSSVVYGACDKKEEAAPGTSSVPTPSNAGAAAASAALPIASAVATALASATPSFAAAGSAVAAMPSSVGSAAASAASSAKVGNTASAVAAANAKPVGMHVTGNNFAVDVSAPGNCAVDTSCTMAIKLTALGKFHINDEYPYKWVGDPIDGIDYTGKKTGDFKKESPTQGTLLVSFKSAGQNAKVAGVYKMSVCSEDKCQIETQRVELNIPMM